MWQEFTKPHTMLPILSEFEIRTSKGEFLLISRHPCESLSHSNRRRQFFSKHFIQFGFVIEQIKLRRGAILKQINNSFCPGCKMGKTCHSQFFFATASKQIRNQ